MATLGQQRQAAVLSGPDSLDLHMRGAFSGTSLGFLLNFKGKGEVAINGRIAAMAIISKPEGWILELELTGCNGHDGLCEQIMSKEYRHIIVLYSTKRRRGHVITGLEDFL
jgi:hypothetical protein